MKKILIITILIISVLFVNASPINETTAKKVAINFMNGKRAGNNVITNVLTEKLNGDISFYVVNFSPEGWVMVSATKTAIPVLCYSYIGEYKIDDEKPGAFLQLTNTYKHQIKESRNLKSANLDLEKKWNELLNGENLKSATYTVGSQLLNVSGRGHVQWRQGTNNSGGCTPSYNSKCPPETCDCDHKLVGCGAVAMGQIMWYWQWPLQSTIRAYNWGLMPDKLTNSSSTEEGNEIALLLDDCGDAANKSYVFCNTWTTVNNVEDALKNNFKYDAALKHTKTYWGYDAWCDLIRSEIDNNRPVLYRGDKSDLIGEKHIFIIDGYETSDPDYFIFNFGWGGNYYNLSSHYLNDITPGSSDFTKNQMAVVGISPTYTSNTIISDVSYTTVTTEKFEDAQQSISLPATGKTLTVQNGGNLTFTTGNYLILKPGFTVNFGAEFEAQINSTYGDVVDVSVSTWYDGFSPDGDGINDELVFNVSNADSWEFEAFDLAGSPIFQSAGSISGNTVTVWDGTGKYYAGYYACIVRFKNSYGRFAERAYNIMAQY